MANSSQIRETLQKLEEGVMSLFDSTRFAEYLKTMSRFHKYSFRNSMLIFMQRPSATVCAGYDTWRKKFKRQVNKGESAIRILAPIPYKKEVEGERVDVNGQSTTETFYKEGIAFRMANVFDVSQTTGEPLPTLVDELTGDLQNYSLFIDALRQVSPLPIEFEQIKGEMKGYCELGVKIVVRSGMSESQTFKTTIHEIAHAKLHDRTRDKKNVPKQEGEEDDLPKRNVRELEAESVAFVVSDHFGLDTSSYSFGYLASWSKTPDVKELSASLDRIHKAAAEIIDGIEDVLNKAAKGKIVS